MATAIWSAPALRRTRSSKHRLDVVNELNGEPERGLRTYPADAQVRVVRDATWLWAGIFAATTVGLAVLMVSESASMFLVLTAALTAGGVVVGIAPSVLWFIRALRRSGLRVRLAQT
jgi:hypothetical protein